MKKIYERLLQSQTETKTIRCFDHQTKTTKIKHDLTKTFSRHIKREKTFRLPCCEFFSSPASAETKALLLTKQTYYQRF